MGRCSSDVPPRRSQTVRFSSQTTKQNLFGAIGKKHYGLDLQLATIFMNAIRINQQQERRK
jgi:hypothetical protein